MHSRALVALFLAGCSAPTLDLSARRTVVVDGGLEWLTLIVATDAFGNPGRGAVDLESPSAAIERSPGSLDADGVASFITRCSADTCAEPIELRARWSGLTSTRTRLARVERWADSPALGTGGGGMGGPVPKLPTVPGCAPGEVCVGESWSAPPPAPCVDSALGGTASLHLTVHGPASAADRLEVTLSNGVLASCRAVELNGDTTFAGLSPGRWTVSARGAVFSGSTTLAVSGNSLVTEARLLVR